jgi:hypothetical protein
MDEVKTTTEAPAETTTTPPAEEVVEETVETTETEEQTQVAPEKEIVSDDNSADEVSVDISTDPEVAHIFEEAERFGISKEKALELGEDIVDVVDMLQVKELSREVPQEKPTEPETKTIEPVVDVELDEAVENGDIESELAEKIKAKEVSRQSELSELKAEFQALRQTMQQNSTREFYAAVDNRFDVHLDSKPPEYEATLGKSDSLTKEQHAARKKVWKDFDKLAQGEGTLGNPIRERALIDKALRLHSDISKKAEKALLKSKLDKLKGGMLPKSNTVPSKPKNEDPRKAYIREYNQYNKERGLMP